MHTAACPPHLSPSLFADLRSRPYEPLMADRVALARYEIPQTQRHYGLKNVYHPIIRALAPPACSGAWVRVPVAVYLQVSIDATCGVLAAACALGALSLNRRDFASAMLSEHKLQLVIATVIFAQAAAAGAAWGLFLAVI